MEFGKLPGIWLLPLELHERGEEIGESFLKIQKTIAEHLAAVVLEGVARRHQITRRVATKVITSSLLWSKRISSYQS
jgi:hypothetical protein